MSHNVDDEVNGQPHGSSLKSTNTFPNGEDSPSEHKIENGSEEPIQTKFKFNFPDLERFFTIFLTTLEREEVDILYKVILNLLALPKETTVEQFQSGLDHDLESFEDLKKLALYDQFKWTIKNWKTLFTEDT